MVAKPLLEPFLFAPDGVHVYGAPLQSVADNVLEADARIALNADYPHKILRYASLHETKRLVAVEDDEAFRNALDRVAQQRLGLLRAAKGLHDAGSGPTSAR